MQGLSEVKEGMVKAIESDVLRQAKPFSMPSQLLEALTTLAKKRMPPLLPHEGTAVGECCHLSRCLRRPFPPEYVELASKYLGDGSHQNSVAELTALLGDLGFLVYIPRDVRINHSVIVDPRWMYQVRWFTEEFFFS